MIKSLEEVVVDLCISPTLRVFLKGAKRVLGPSFLQGVHVESVGPADRQVNFQFTFLWFMVLNDLN